MTFVYSIMIHSIPVSHIPKDPSNLPYQPKCIIQNSISDRTISQFRLSEIIHESYGYILWYDYYFRYLYKYSTTNSIVYILSNGSGGWTHSPEDCHIPTNYAGVSLNGGYPIAGWFINDTPMKKKTWFGGTPIVGNLEVSTWFFRESKLASWKIHHLHLIFLALSQLHGPWGFPSHLWLPLILHGFP